MFNKYSYSSHGTLCTYIHAVLAELSHFLPRPHLLPVGNGMCVSERLWNKGNIIIWNCFHSQNLKAEIFANFTSDREKNIQNIMGCKKIIKLINWTVYSQKKTHTETHIQTTNKHAKKCSAPVATRETSMKRTWRFHPTSVGMPRAMQSRRQGGWGEQDPHLWLVGMRTCAATKETSVRFPHTTTAAHKQNKQNHSKTPNHVISCDLAIPLHQPTAVKVTLI